MNGLLERIREHASIRPEATALRDEIGELSYAELHDEIERLAGDLDGRRVGLLLDNGIHWACLDLALLRKQALCVPIPTFFSAEQLAHLAHDAGLDFIYTDRPARMTALPDSRHVACMRIAGHRLEAYRVDRSEADRPWLDDTAKVSYTSGTTGQPKGVRLGRAALQAVTESVCRAVEANSSDRSLSLLPLSTLLENIAGLYAPLMTGASANIPGLASCGFDGASNLDIGQLFEVLNRVAPTTTVLVPQLLKALLAGIISGRDAPASLRFIAVGGAPVPETMLQAARLFGLPVFQGYGLSEACSVACLNLPGRERAGSVGQALPHTRIRIADDGEVMVGGALFQGYLGYQGDPERNEWPTGDIGHLDEDGYLFLTGRKKTAYSTAYGRNVAPEWIESLLTGHPHIAQAAVYGEARPFNVAVLHGRAGLSAQALNEAVASINEHLPGYARIGGWVQADQAFSPGNGLASPTGSIRREAIEQVYRARIELFYEESHAVL